MNVNLGATLDKFIAELLQRSLSIPKRGGAGGAAAPQGTRRPEEMRAAHLRKQIAIGGEQADRGKFVDGAQTFAEIRRRSARRKRAKG
jgi:hypothetical protein